MPKVRTSLIFTGIVIAMLAASILTVLGLFMAGVITLDRTELELSVIEVDAREYDGTPLKAEEYEWISGEDKLKKGHRYEVTILGEQLDCGTSETDLRVTIYDEKDRDVTNGYSIKVTNCKLTVLPREVTIELEGQDVPYRGTEIFLDKYKVSAGSDGDSSTKSELKEKQLAAGDKLAISFPGFVNVADEFPDVDKWTEDNLIIYNAAGRVVTGNYSITPIPPSAPIRIVPRKLSIKAFDAEKYYDGKPIALVYQLVGLTPVGNDFIKDVELVDESGNPVTLSKIIRTEHSKKVRIVGLELWRQDGYDSVPLSDAEANNYAFELADGEDEFISLNILKRPVEVVARDLIKEYDGLALSSLVSTEAPAYTVTGLLSQHTLTAECPDIDEIKEVHDGSYSMGGIVIKENGDDITGQFEITSRAAIARITPITLKVAPSEQKLEYTGEEVEILLSDAIGESLTAAIIDHTMKPHVIVGDDLKELFIALQTNIATYFRLSCSVVMKNAGNYRYTVELSAEGVDIINGNIIFEFSSAALTVKAAAISVTYSGVGDDGKITKTYDGKEADLDHRNLVVEGKDGLTVAAADFIYGPGDNNHAYAREHAVTVENVRITQKKAEGDGTVFEDVTQNYTITTPTLTVKINKAALYPSTSSAVIERHGDWEDVSNIARALANELRSSITFVGTAPGDSVNYDVDRGFTLSFSTSKNDQKISFYVDDIVIFNSAGEDVTDCYDIANDEAIISAYLIN